MKSSLFLLTLSIMPAAFAQSSVDWRQDKDAFASYRGLLPRLPSPPKTSSVSSDAFAIDPEFLRTKLSDLSGANEIELDGRTLRIQERGSTEGRELARRYLKREYERLGFQVSEHAYSQHGINLIAEKPGTEAGKVLIVSSHYDSVSNAGADDDGSGTISTLALAQALSQRTNRYTLRILAFDEEERGLVGSKAYVARLAQTGELANVIADLHMEMNGYNSRKDGAFHVIDCDRDDSRALSAAVMDGVSKLQLPLQRSEACTSASDHSAFWRKGKAAIVLSENFFGDDGNPCYHDSCDRVDILDFGYMANITRAATWAAASILGGM